METVYGKRDRAELKRSFETLLDRYVIGQEQPPFTEQQFLDAAIDFANTGNAQESWMSLLVGVDIQWDFPSVPLAPFESEREAFRTALFEIASGKQLSNLSAIAESAGRMLLVPRVDPSGPKLKTSHWYLPQDLSAALAYVLILFADESKDYGDNLKKCQLNRCQKFFFVKRPKTGRPRTTYCSDEHMQEAHKAMAPQRVRNSRAKKKRSNNRKRQ